MKHAFDDGQQGKIEVLLKAVDKQVNLTVKDNGRGFSGEENIESLGVTLIKTLAKQLEGTVSFKNEDSAKISVLFEAEKVVNT